MEQRHNNPSKDRRVVVFIFLALVHNAWSLVAESSVPKDALILLAKTKETFKLADLQYLEATVQSVSKYDCKRILMDAATGSSLLLLDRLAPDFEANILGEEDCTRHETCLPSSLRSCEWVGEVICQSSCPEEMLKELSTKQSTRNLKAWTLEYLRMIPTKSFKSSRISDKNITYTQKTLCCCIAQQIPVPAVLNPTQVVDRLLVVDTCESMFLVKLLELPSSSSLSSPNLTPQKWAQRPFPYSSATNFQAAEMVMNILLSHRVALRHDLTTKPHFLDATCGSGTFLALVVSRGMQVTGWDSNVRCVEGSQRNLQYAFEHGDLYTVLHRSCLDFPEDLKQAGVEKIDAVACNLPWGLNSNVFSVDSDNIEHNCSSHLLSAIRKVLKPGIPCVFLYKDEKESAHDNLHWKRLGYRVIGHASIPQKDFVLPNRGKKEKKRSEENALTGRSSCIVSLVETII